VGDEEEFVNLLSDIAKGCNVQEGKGKQTRESLFVSPPSLIQVLLN